jgi:hypothetical protein
MISGNRIPKLFRLYQTFFILRIAIQCAMELQMNASLLLSYSVFIVSVETKVRFLFLRASEFQNRYIAEPEWKNCRPLLRCQFVRSSAYVHLCWDHLSPSNHVICCRVTERCLKVQFHRKRGLCYAIRTLQQIVDAVHPAQAVHALLFPIDFVVQITVVLHFPYNL